jgi:hypothetical protein
MRRFLLSLVVCLFASCALPLTAHAGGPWPPNCAPDGPCLGQILPPLP